MFPTQESLQAPVPTLRALPGLVRVLQLAELFAAPTGLPAECPRGAPRRRGMPATARLNIATTSWQPYPNTHVTAKRT